MSISKEERGFSIRGELYSEFIFDCKSLFAIKLFWFLVQNVKLENNNCVFVKQQVMADKFKVSRQALRKPLIELVRLEAIKKIKNGYMVNPSVEVKEYTQLHKQTLARWYG